MQSKIILYLILYKINHREREEILCHIVSDMTEIMYISH